MKSSGEGGGIPLTLCLIPHKASYSGPKIDNKNKAIQRKTNKQQTQDKMYSTNIYKQSVL